MKVNPRAAGGGYAGEPTERGYMVEYRRADGKPPTKVLINGAAAVELPTGGGGGGLGKDGWWVRAECKAATCTYDQPAVVVQSGKAASVVGAARCRASVGLMHLNLGRSMVAYM